MSKQPLAGWKVLVPRPAESAFAAAKALRAAGAEPVCVPLIRICPPDDEGAALRAATARVEEYDWVIATSAPGAKRLLRVLGDAARLRSVAAIGPATASCFAAAGRTVDLIPERFVAEGLLEALAGTLPAKALLARAAEARDVLPEGLRAAGWDVEVVAAYQVERVALGLSERAAVESCDALLFTSPSVVNSYCEQLPAPKGVVACIGPITAAAARGRGMRVDVEASDYTIPGLIGALTAYIPRKHRGT